MRYPSLEDIYSCSRSSSDPSCSDSGIFFSPAQACLGTERDLFGDVKAVSLVSLVLSFAAAGGANIDAHSDEVGAFLPCPATGSAML